MDKIPLFKKSDIVLTVVLLLVALVFFLPSVFSDEKSLTAVITVDSEVVTQISLSENTSETVEIGGVVVKAEGRQVYFEQSDCPDKVCVRTGKLDSAGDSSACVPNRVSVFIKGEKAEDGVDIIAY